MSNGKPYCYAYPHPAVTTDVVLFSIRNGRLTLLLIRRRGEPFKEHWALALEQIEETGERRMRGSHRPARLYRLKHPDQTELIQ